MEGTHHEEILPGAGMETMEPSTLLHDSMVTVRLSEPPALTVDTISIASGGDIEEEQTPPDSLPQTPDFRFEDVDQLATSGVAVMDNQEPESPTSRRGSAGTETSEEGDVNWEELEKTEEQEPRDQDSEESTALLLARLEQENNLLVKNPKSGLTNVTIVESGRQRKQSRPPSMQQLRKLVNNQTLPALRYSLLPAPPMTDLDFYAALVQDYTRTAQRLPTLLSKKIRSGVPPPLRGVVWQSMSGARDALLEEQFDRLCNESSPYEGIIGKDLGRSFPGVEMFRDPEGDGQRMLGRVLKCFSLYDHKIGYCQGLGFLVGPLLMHMGDKQAFCVLVRLMERYDLRNCFLPDLSGLHVRIYQFRELLKRHLPDLSSHLEILQVEPAYVSQWFLSFFAVTCPLPMLFRIYDVIFAEGASETIMRVALSVMRKNEEKIRACTEFEDVMQLLLSRGLWDCYHYNADEFVNDFVSLTSVVTNESLQALEISYRDSQSADTSPSSDVGSAASRFLGRLWAGSNMPLKSANLSPSMSAPSRPVSFLRRTPSKQSIASTLNSMEGGTDSIMSTATDATNVSRESANTDYSTRAQSTIFGNSMSANQRTSSNNQKDLHGQIEDLLMALSELQRDQAILSTQLQKEREEREEDRHAVRSLLDGLRKKSSSETMTTSASEESFETVTQTMDEDGQLPSLGDPQETDSQEIDPQEIDSQEIDSQENDFQETDSQETDSQETVTEVEGDLQSDGDDTAEKEARQNNLSSLLDIVEARFAKKDNRRSSMLQSKSQLREELARSKEQLVVEYSKSQDLGRRLGAAEHELAILKDQVKETHNHLRNGHQEKQRLEKQLYDLRSRRMAANSPESPTGESDWPKRVSAAGGLRELRLGRTNSTLSQGSVFAKRTSSLNSPTFPGKENEIPISPAETTSTPPAIENDALVLELVQAKTAEAVAKQEAEEAKAKLESLRKLLGVSNSESLGHRPSPSQPNIERNATLGAFSSYMGRPGDQRVVTPPVATPVSATGGFWGGWGKRTASTSQVPVLDKA